jgi:phenylacetate-coenzyme A ligase PaaK-like adenylate-forming protein
MGKDYILETGMGTCYVEKWLHDKVRQAAKNDPEFGGRECCKDPSDITRSDIEAFQFFRLKKMLHYAFEKSKFYNNLFCKTGITPDDIRSMDDFVKLPFTEPDNLVNIYHQFVCVSLKEFEQEYLFDTSGTEGKAKRVVCTQQDIDRMVDFMSAGMSTVAKSGDVIMLILPDGKPNSQADLLSRGVLKMGGIPIVSDIGASPEEHIKTIERHHPSVIFTSPSRIHRITMGYKPRNRLGDLAVKTLFLTSEHVSGAMRKKLRDIWNCDIHGHYGMTEMGLGVSVECHAHDGYHFNEADLLLEVINPESGEIIKDDREGELVFTTLTREGTPLIRYRTKDLSRLIRKPCPCGAVTLKRIGAPVRKMKSIVTIGSEDKICPAFFDDVLYDIPEVVDYQLVITQEGDKESLKFTVEITEDGIETGKEIIKRLLELPVISININAGRLLSPQVEVVSMGTLIRGTRAKKLIVDNRRITDLVPSGYEREA